MWTFKTIFDLKKCGRLRFYNADVGHLIFQHGVNDLYLNDRFSLCQMSRLFEL